ncbi:MAG: hypothetical protein E7162_01750 [Firmicutes bacterium]|nr:hypothetical protein [Bacillota bacterium]
MRLIKNNKLYFISLLILIGWFLVALNISLSDFNKNKQFIQEQYNDCLTKGTYDVCKNLKIQLDEYKIAPAPVLYNYVISLSENSMEYLGITAVIFVSIPAIYSFYVDVKSGIFISKLSRKKYKDFILDHYKNSLKALLILPLFLIITFFLVCCISGFRFEVGNDILSNSSLDYVKTRWIPYYSTMLFVLIAHSQFYINLAYISFYKVKNFIVNILLTYLLYIFSQTIVVFSLEFILSRVLNITNNDFILSFEDPIIMKFGADISNFSFMIINSIIYVIISSMLVYLFYRKKERFVMNNE